ncbi:MAG: septum formation initiator family protein [Ruminococcus sp.]|jgi:cell division protein DivIC|nr:septum formation initiator family protein [Ruminococcus sp.]
MRKNKHEKKEKVTEEKKNEIKEVTPQKKKLNKKFILLYAALAAFIVYASFTIVNQSIQISEKKDELNKIDKQLQIVEIKSDYLKEIKNYKGKELSEYMENIAREDLDYIKNGERVFVNVSGD